MADCRIYIPEYQELACTFENGRVNAIAFVVEEKAVLADADTSLWSTPSFWSTEDYTGDINIHQKVSGSYSASTSTIAGKGNQQQRNSGKTHTLDVRVESVKGNEGYWDDFNISNDYRVIFVGDNYGTLFVPRVNCRIDANLVIDDDLSSIQEWSVICEWSEIKIPQTFDVPAGIFN